MRKLTIAALMGAMLLSSGAVYAAGSCGGNTNCGSCKQCSPCTCQCETCQCQNCGCQSGCGK